VEVGPDHHHARREPVDEHLAHELLSGLAGPVGVEPQHGDEVDEVGTGEQFDLVVGSREQQRRRVRSHDPGRMPIEGDAHRVEPSGIGEFPHQLQHPSMPLVHPVERADRDDAAPGPRARDLLLAHDAGHPAASVVAGAGVRVATTTAGFSAAPRRS